MEGVSRGHSKNHAMDESGLAAALRQAEAELSQRKVFEEEQALLLADLESRLSQTTDELMAANQNLRLEGHTRVSDQREIRRLRENLARREQAFSMVSQELESLSYGISHDLRSPLRHLIGFSTALVEDFGDGLESAARGYLDCIIRAGLKLESRIESLLKLSRIARQELKTESVDLAEMARGFAASLKGAAPDRKAIFTLPDEVPVRADAELMKAVMGNLFDNAWKFAAKAETALIEFGVKEEGGATVYYLRDNGVGFNMEYASRLFGPFQRMHGEGEFEGAGIGLAIVQRIIHRHGGRIWADAAVGDGATFSFTLSDRTSALEI